MKEKGNFIHWLIYLTLLILIGGGAYFATAAQQERQAQIEHTEERRAAYQEHVEQMQEMLDIEYRVITSARDGYHADAYESSVERIAEQQLIAAEYQLLLLQVIAQQNAQMIELMVAAGA